MVLPKYKKKTKQYPKIGRKTVRSNFEYAVWKAVQNLLPNKWLAEYEPEKIAYKIEAEYTPDIVITKKSGDKMYIEVKGNGRQFDHAVQRKMIAVKNQNPDMDLRIIFYSDGKIGSKRVDGSFRKQSDWATKYGFIFAISELPREWFDE